MVKSKKKNRISKRTITIACILIVLAGAICGITIFIGLGGNRIFTNGNVTVEQIQANMKSAISGYTYALQTLDIEKTVANQGSTTCRYVLSSTKDKKERSYVYLDSDGVELYQYWDYDPEAENYCIYIYDSDEAVWVKTSYTDEPVTGTPWDVFDNLTEYTLLDNTECWYGTEDECYVLELIGQTDDYAVLYEEVFIRKSDYMPMGIVTYGVSDVNEDKMVKGEEISIGSDNIESAEVEVPTYNECVQMYEVTFSNEDLKMFAAPDVYLSEEDYMSLIRARESEESEE